MRPMANHLPATSPAAATPNPMALNVYPSPGEVEQAANQTREIEQSPANGQKQRQAEALRTENRGQKAEDEQSEMTQITENKSKIPQCLGSAVSHYRYQKEIESLTRNSLPCRQNKPPCFGTGNIPAANVVTGLHMPHIQNSHPWPFISHTRESDSGYFQIPASTLFHCAHIRLIESP